jgi:hypothetical protein
MEKFEFAAVAAANRRLRARARHSFHEGGTVAEQAPIPDGYQPLDERSLLRDYATLVGDATAFVNGIAVDSTVLRDREAMFAAASPSAVPVRGVGSRSPTSPASQLSRTALRSESSVTAAAAAAAPNTDASPSRMLQQAWDAPGPTLDASYTAARKYALECRATSPRCVTSVD